MFGVSTEHFKEVQKTRKDPWEFIVTGLINRLLVPTPQKTAEYKIREYLRDRTRFAITDDMVQVLAGLLAIDPEKRLTVEQAMQLPFFAKERNRVHKTKFDTSHCYAMKCSEEMPVPVEVIKLFAHSKLRVSHLLKQKKDELFGH